MKRSWIGLLLLVVLLGVGLLTTWAMEETHEPIAEKLEEAAEAAGDKAWRSAAWLTASARKDWEKWTLLRAALLDHGPTEDVQTLFAVLEVYGRAQDPLPFAAVCRELAQRIEAMSEAHGLKIENIL